jgi:uncharacterized integral membrane protein
MRQLRWLLGVILFAGGALLLVSFVLSNPDPVVLDLPFVDTLRAPLWLALGGAFFAGGLAASAGLLFQLARKSLAARRFEKRVAGLESELTKLRNLPLAANDPLLAPEPGAPRTGS